MKKLLLLLFLIPNLVMGEEVVWDLDKLVKNVQISNTEINLVDHRGTILQTFSKTYTLKIDDIRRKISSVAGIHPKFLISSDNNVNAYATWTNGQPTTIYTLGLLRKIDNDYDALAAIIGHEYAHLTLSHQDSSKTTSFMIDLLATVALVAIDVSYGGSNYNQYRKLYKAGLNVASNLSKSTFSRSAELAADSQGLQYLISAGYSPAGAKRFHLAMNTSSGFFSTHPSSEERIKRIDYAINNHNRALRSSSNNKHANDIENKSLNVTEVQSSKVDNKNALIEVGVNETANTICLKNGYEKDTSQHFACVFKYKKIKKQNNDILEATNSYKNNSDLPKKGQVGMVVLVNKEKGIVIFSQSIMNRIMNGTPVIIEEGSKKYVAKVTGYYDGFYSAKLNNSQEVKKGSRVIVN